MKSIRSNLQKLAKSTLRLNFVLLSSCLLTIFFFGASYWAIYEVIETQRAKVNYHYLRLMGGIHEHEFFLLQAIRSTNSMGYKPEVISTAPRVAKTEANNLSVYEVAAEAPTLTFSMIFPHSNQEGTATQNPLRRLELGTMLANFHRSFWSDSTYSAPHMLLLDLNNDDGVVIPAISLEVGRDNLARNGLLRVVDKVINAVRENPPAGGGLRVYWSPGGQFLGGNSKEAIAYVSDHIPKDIWTANGRPPDLVAATLFELNSLNDYGPFFDMPVFDSLDLVSPHGVVLAGSGSAGQNYKDGIYLTLNGLLIKRSSGSGNSWHALYHIGYEQVFFDAKWQLLNVVVLFITCLVLGWGLLRWQRRHIVNPAGQYYGSLVKFNESSQAIIQATPIALCVIHEHSRQLVMQNELALTWFGDRYDIAELTRDWHMYEDGRPVSGETCVIVGELYLHARFAPTIYQGQSVLLCAFIDITAHKETESELVFSRNAANTANAEKSRFLATMSHEIRTPLYGVVGTLELLGLTRLSVQQQGYLRTIKGSSNILLQLISDILDISKIESGEMSLETASFSPLDIVEQALRNYSAIAHGKGLLLYSCVDTDIPGSVLGDSMRIRQIVNNLLNNAIKFTRTGRVTLHLIVLGREESRVRLQWQVVDTGVGISKAQQARLFEPFFQANNQQHALSGSGLGLSICSQLCQMMHGTLDVVSAPGLGSSFSFELELQELETAVQLPHAVRTENTKIHVRSPASELSSDVCQWLEMTVGNVVDMDEQGAEQPDPSAILLELMPESLPPLEWQGPRVIAQHDASIQPQPCEQGWRVSLHSRLGMTHAVMAALGWHVPVLDALEQGMPMEPLGLRVLLAEDHPVNQTLLAEQLEQLGCTVTLVSNGEQALRRLESAGFDVVLTDINMPVMDGYELAEHLRQSGNVLPIIAVTANALREEQDRCITAGMNAWLSKPIVLETLYGCLKKTAGKGKATMSQVVIELDAGVSHNDNIQIAGHVLDVFLYTMREDMAAIKTALSRDDLVEVKRLLHRIRGALAVAKAPELIATCRTVEAALADNNSTTAIFELTRWLDRVENALKML